MLPCKLRIIRNGCPRSIKKWWLRIRILLTIRRRSKNPSHQSKILQASALSSQLKIKATWTFKITATKWWRSLASTTSKSRKVLQRVQRRGIIRDSQQHKWTKISRTPTTFWMATLWRRIIWVIIVVWIYRKMLAPATWHRLLMAIATTTIACLILIIRIIARPP